MARRVEDGSNSLGRDPISTTVNIGERQRFICAQFSQLYSELGYQSVPPEGLLPTEDTTVIFTGATITPLKKFLFEGITPPGYFIVQKCLRTQGTNAICDLNVIPSGMNYFTMCGILASPERREEVANEGYDLLVNRFGIPKKNLLIQATSSDKNLSQPWKDKGIIVEEDKQPEDSYRWRYGIPDAYGRGINIFLRFNNNDAFREIGNQISIHDGTGRIIGYEFGFGLESLLAKMNGFKKSTEANTVSAAIPYEEGVREKLVNALATCVVLYHHGINPGKGKERYILKKYVKGLSFLRRQLDVSIDQLREYGDAYESAEFTTAHDSGNKVAEGVIAYENKLSKFLAYAKNQVHAHRLRGSVDEYLREKLLREGNNMGILPVEINEIVNVVLP